MTLLLARKIQIGKFYGTFQLVDTVTSEKDLGYMRVDDIDPIDAGTIGSWVSQEGDDVVLILSSKSVAHSAGSKTSIDFTVDNARLGSRLAQRSEA